MALHLSSARSFISPDPVSSQTLQVDRILGRVAVSEPVARVLAFHAFGDDDNSWTWLRLGAVIPNIADNLVGGSK